MVDLLFLAKNRLEFTREALQALRQNTNWEKVGKLYVYDDGSTDGTQKYLPDEVVAMKGFDLIPAEIRQTRLGSPILVMNNFITRSKAPLVAKIDSDTIVPPDWLDISLDIMESQPEVDCLGLEYRGLSGGPPPRAVAADHIGGLFVAHRRAFRHDGLPVPAGRYFGWQDYQKRHGLRVCWIQPSIAVFLLDRVPDEPYVSLSRKYEAAGWQRPWEHYRPDQAELWKWWTEKRETACA